jgi:hypothetical protein
MVLRIPLIIINAPFAECVNPENGETRSSNRVSLQGKSGSHATIERTTRTPSCGVFVPSCSYSAIALSLLS